MLAPSALSPESAETVIPHRKMDIAVCLIALLLCQARVWGVALPSGGVREVVGPASSSVSQSAKGQWLWSYLHGFATTRPSIGSGLAKRQELDDFGNVLLYHLQMNFQNDGASSPSESDDGGKTVPTPGRTAITNEALAPAPYGMSSHGTSWHLASNDVPAAFLPWQNVHAPPILRGTLEERDNLYDLCTISKLFHPPRLIRPRDPRF